MARLRRISLAEMGAGSCAVDVASRDEPTTCTSMYGLENVLSRVGGSEESPLGGKEGGRAGSVTEFLDALDEALVH